MTRSWTDQPAELEEMPVRCTFQVRAGSNTLQAEVRGAGAKGPFYITVGTLFGSETVKCRDIDTLFTTIDVVNRTRPPYTLPDGATLISSPFIDSAEMS